MTRWRELPEIREQFGVAAVQAAYIDSAGQLDEAAVGATEWFGWPVSAHTLFPVGCVAKLFTAVMALQLADIGALSLDTPVRHFFPRALLRTTPPNVRELLTNQSGLGDPISRGGRGDDAVQRTALGLLEAEPAFDPGFTTSASHGGGVVAGGIVERVIGVTWDEALRAAVVLPVELSSTHSLPEAALGWPIAVGPEYAENAGMDRGAGPIGSTLLSTARDLARFGRAILECRSGSSSSPLLSPSRAQSLFDQGVPGVSGDAALYKYSYGCQASDGVLFAVGMMPGVRAELRIDGQRNTVAAVCVQGYEIGVLLDTLLPELAMPQRFECPELRVRRQLALSSEYVGEYRSYGETVTVALEGDGLLVRKSGERRTPPYVARYTSFAHDVFTRISTAISSVQRPMRFLRNADGAVTFAHVDNVPHARVTSE